MKIRYTVFEKAKEGIVKIMFSFAFLVKMRCDENGI